MEQHGSIPKEEVFFRKKEDHHAKRSPRQNLKDVRGKAQEGGTKPLREAYAQGSREIYLKNHPSGLMATVNRNLFTPVGPLEDRRQFLSPDPPLQEDLPTFDLPGLEEAIKKIFPEAV